jgi:hypothetical protein
VLVASSTPTCFSRSSRRRRQRSVGYVIITGYTSVNAIVKVELFPAEIRALGVGLGCALANSVFGGTAPLLYQASKPDHVTLFIVYVTVVLAAQPCTPVKQLRYSLGVVRSPRTKWCR